LRAIVLTRRLRDIGWPVWIGPTILLVMMLGSPFLAVGFAMMNLGDQITWSIALYSLIKGFCGPWAADRRRVLRAESPRRSKSRTYSSDRSVVDRCGH
jgi:hypothetical protein